MSAPSPPEQFNTWSEIAGYLGISVREAQYRERNEGLPVRRMGGKKPRVWALRAELDAWRLNGGATKFIPALNPAVNQASANAASPCPSDEGSARTVQWGRRALFGVAGLAAAGVGVKLISGLRKPTVERAVLTGSLLTALDGLGSPIWTHRFPGILRESSTADLPWRVQVIDLEGSGKPGVLAVCSRIAEASTPQLVIDEISYFLPDGRLKWTLICRPDLLDFDGRQFEPVWWCSHVIAVPSGKRQTLWVGVNHGWRWPGCVLRVNANGAAYVQFANAGYVERLCRLRRPNGEFIAIAGENNAFNRACAAVLGADDPASCSPSGGAARCHFANAPSGMPRDYLMFPTTEMVAAGGNPYGAASQVFQTNDGGFVVSVSAGGSTMAYLLYEFSEASEARSVMPSGSCPIGHRRLEGEGKLNHAWAECPELQQPLTIRHWRPGSGWQDQKFPWRATTDKA